VSEEQSENAPEEMKAAVNLCQQCQGWGGCSLQSKEEQVFIIICHPSAEKWIFFQDFFLFFAAWTNFEVIAVRFPLASQAVVYWEPLANKFGSIASRFYFEDLMTAIAGISNYFL